jgi:branched-chain amino acid transport system substrate-binding protein
MIPTRIVRILAPVAGAAALVTLASACGGGGDSTEVFRVGVAGPLEQALGAHTLRGAELARDRINAGGGIDGRQLELLPVTDSASSQHALAVAGGFLADNSVAAVLGHSTSGATLSAASIYGQGLAAVSATATSPEITNAGPWIFRVAPSDAASAARLADFALRELGQRAVILYANDAFGRGLREAFGSAYANGGGTIVDEYPYIEGTTDDFEPYLMGIQASRPDLVFVAGLDYGGSRIIRQARQMGIEAPIMGGDGLLGLVGQDPVFDGTFVMTFYHAETPGELNAEFVRAYRAAYGEDPDAWAAMAYDAVMLIAKAAAEVGFNRQEIRDYLEGVGRSRDNFAGVSGTIAFDENGDPVDKGVAIGRISGNGIELVSVEGGL